MRESVERGSNLCVRGWVALSLFTPVDLGFDLDNELVLVEGTTDRVLNANTGAVDYTHPQIAGAMNVWASESVGRGSDPPTTGRVERRTEDSPSRDTSTRTFSSSAGSSEFADTAKPFDLEIHGIPLSFRSLSR